MMDFTFGIITDGSTNVPPRATWKPAKQRILEIIASIRDLNIPKTQIIVVGGKPIPGITHVPFDESIKMAWITKKKNLITQVATCPNVVYMHDYVKLDKNWYQGFRKFGDKFNACMTPMLKLDGTRYRDWTISPGVTHIMDVPISRGEYMLPYEETRLSKWQYFSGAYWIAKKSVMEEYPLDENLVWGQGEDIVWSTMVRNKYVLQINPYSMAYIMKPKDTIFHQMRPETLQRIKQKLEQKDKYI